MNDQTHDPGRLDRPPATDRRPAAEAIDEQPALTRPGPRTRRWAWIAAAVALAVLALAAWYWFGHGSSDQAKGGGKGDAASRPMPVVAAPARKGNIDVSLDALGTVTPLNNVVVRARVDGQLMSVAFREGQNVKAGDLLAQIDPRPFEVMLTQANGQMARDQAQLKNAQVDLERYQTLLAQDSISRQQVDTQAALVRQFQGAVESDKGAIDNARLQLTYARITAPISGRVGLRQVDPGNIVHASDSNGVVTITQVQPVTVIYPVPEDNVPRIVKRMQTAQSVPVDAFDRGGKTRLATGRLLTMDNQIDTATGTVKVKAEFPNTDGALFPNQFVNVRMVVETHEDTTLVPTAAIQRGAPGTFVFLVKEDKTVAVTPVQVGAVSGETTEVSKGLAPGNLVVVDGADKLRDGASVELIDAAARATQQAAPPRQNPPGAGKGGNGQGRRGKGGG
ncbi:MAG TPA: MdtA/MuxA family multidrug efflux RND transporter periplasmic adaptor subunit [Casimicrobiaceae bacterium]|jgi:multidrug efflux system membrane fusion protein|nr:MdtA/MuxA family multidrug efflux RND transporter periplasmic adaptor subunit [Casimicrobiaceae bacterium]